MRPLTSVRFAAVLALLSTLAVPASAQQMVNHLYDKFTIGFTASDVILSSTFRIDNSDGTRGTDINFNTLGINEQAFAPALGINWRPGRRHELGLAYVYIDRSGNKTLTDTVNFGDTSFAAGVRIKSSFSAPSLAFSYRFSIIAKENVQVGAQVSLGALFFKVGINALAGATGGGSDTTTVQYTASKGLTGPTAALGAFANFRSGEHWTFSVNGGYIGASFSGISASSWVAGGDARYFFSNTLGIAAGYSLNGIKITGENPDDNVVDLRGTIKYSFQVLRLSLLYTLH